MLATGVAAAMLAAVMVIAVTPPRSNAPTALSATTLPPITVQLRPAAVQTEASTPVRHTQPVGIGNSTMTVESSLALVGAPTALSSAPVDHDALAVGASVPAGDERVYVFTDSHTYSVWWSQLDRLVAPDGAVVVNADGELVATFSDDQLVVLVD